jgi:flagellar biosynthesis chaperone FliJ
MKTQFTDLLKISKNKLQTLEREVALIRAKIENINLVIIEKEEEILKEEILKIEYPISGTFSVFQQYNITMHNMKRYIEDLKLNKLSLTDKINNIRQKMVEVNREIEKFKYLENQVLEARREELKKLEEKNLDEIAVMLYKKDKNI